MEKKGTKITKRIFKRTNLENLVPAFKIDYKAIIIDCTAQI